MLGQPIGLDAAQFERAFPFHLAVDDRGLVLQAGAVLRRLCPGLTTGSPFDEHFELVRPSSSRLAALATQDGAPFTIQLRVSQLQVRGQVMPSANRQTILLLGAPWITDATDVTRLGLRLADLTYHDAIGDYLVLFQAKDAALSAAETLTDQLREQDARLREVNERLAREISDRQRAEVTLRDTESMYRQVVDSLKEVIFQTDSAGRLTFLNPAWTEITGFTLEESLGRSVLTWVHPDDRAAEREQFTAAVSRRGEFTRHEVRHLTRDGSYRWLEVYARLICDDHGGVTGTSGTLNDVTLRHENEANLVLANAELSRASRLKDEFLSSMSHELRTPLNAVLGMSEALLEGVYGSLDERQMHALRQVETSGRHLLDLINDILDLSKIEAGKLTLEVEPTYVTMVCNAALAMVKGAAHRKRLTLEHQYDPRVETIDADQRRLKQILVNLLSNAVKFTPEEGLVRVDVEARPEQGVAAISVTDTGIGIDPDALTRLFQPFTQLDSRLSRQYSGTGLGLALVRRMVEMHGGTVSVVSTPGRGSTFTVTLPWQPAPPAGAPAPATPAPGAEGAAATAACQAPAPAAAPDGPPRRILVVDDSESNAEMLAEYLKSRGYRTLVAFDGLQAIDQAIKHRPDLILMDVQMPDMDGLEAIRIIRSDPVVGRVTIFAFTALAMSGDRERCLEAGADDYHSKPVKLAELARRIGELFESKVTS